MKRALALLCLTVATIVLVTGRAESVPMVRGKTIAKSSTPLPIDDPKRIALVKEGLGVTYPFGISLLSRPGPIGTIVDSLGKKACFRFDNRTIVADSTGKLPQRLMTIGCTEDTTHLPHAAPSGSAEESALVAAFHLYIDTFIRPDQRDSLLNTPHYYWYRLSQEQNTARELLGVTGFLERQASGLAPDSAGRAILTGPPEPERVFHRH